MVCPPDASIDGTDGITVEAGGGAAGLLANVATGAVLGTMGIVGGIPTIGEELAPPVAGRLLEGNAVGELPATVLGKLVAPIGVGTVCCD